MVVGGVYLRRVTTDRAFPLSKVQRSREKQQACHRSRLMTECPPCRTEDRTIRNTHQHKHYNTTSTQDPTTIVSDTHLPGSWHGQPVQLEAVGPVAVRGLGL